MSKAKYIGISLPDRFRPLLEKLKEESEGLRDTYSEVIQYLLTREADRLNKNNIE